MELISAPNENHVGSTGTFAAAKAQKPFTVEVALIGVVQGGTEMVALLKMVEVGPSTSKLILTGEGNTAGVVLAGGVLSWVVVLGSVEVGVVMSGGVIFGSVEEASSALA